MRTCPHCGCSDIDEDPARGDATCMGCGTVLEESIVVTENQFQERAGGSGGHSLVGQFVSAERAASNNFHGMGTQESREMTHAKGKKVLEEIASQLRINQHCLDTAFNFFKMCVSRNLTRGRTRTAVVAVCLYMTCRLENTAHLLLDFSDVTQINVFDLGRNLTFISRSLRINLPATDPCMYILRFACMLDLGEKQKEVVTLATRLVQRMKRDWMSTGRRPTGICGAALLIAARSLNFNRSVSDIVRVVHISESVIRKRLDEFSQTPSGSLTIEEFSTVDLEHSEDPPAFRDSRRKAREEQLRKECEQLDECAEQMGEMETQVEIALEKRRKEKFRKSPYAKLVSTDIDGVEKGAADHVRNEILDYVYDAADEHPTTYLTSEQMATYGPSLETMGIRRSDEMGGGGQEGASTSSKGKVVEAKEEESISDTEIDSYILTEKEVQIKTEYWMKANGEVMKAIEERRKEREEHGEVKRKRKPTKKTDGSSGQCLSAYDAMEKVICEKRLSNKINYDMLKDIDTFSKNRKPVIPEPKRDDSSKSDTQKSEFTEDQLTKSERCTRNKNTRDANSEVLSKMDALRTAFDLPTPTKSTIPARKINKMKPNLTKMTEKEPPISKETIVEEQQRVEDKSTDKTDEVVIVEKKTESKPIDTAKSRYSKMKPNLKMGKKTKESPSPSTSTEPEAKKSKT